MTELLLTRIQPLELVTVNQYTDPTSESFETLLLKAHPETALIHELGSRLRTLPLPIADWDDLVGKLQDGPVPELLQVPE
ncbi:hypothetical protein [Streptomyces virginiae]|uniref:Uncharacterized protein n=1 Tax=Streptomyces virginiae TaxID=1961 RepID=A0ABZ1TQH9_STRVG|nr:hypothetical protein [Streptomyces virginiae]